MTETEQKTEVQQQEEERPSEWSELTGLLRQMQEDAAEPQAVQVDAGLYRNFWLSAGGCVGGGSGALS